MSWKIKDKKVLSVGDIQGDLLEPKALPLGRQEFMEWSERIIKGAMVPGATHESLRFALASMIMCLGPTEAFKEDAHFILSLRKACVNEVVHSFMVEAKEEQKRKQAEATAPNLKVVADGVLEKKTIQDPT